MTYVKWGSIALAAIALIALGWWLGSRVSATALANERAAASNQQRVNDDLVISTLQTQLADSKTVAAHNSEVIRDLNAKTVSTESERDDAQRLLDAARHSFATAISGLSKTDDRPAVAQASQPPGDAILRDALAAVGAECKNNADRLDSLISEIQPQLR